MTRARNTPILGIPCYLPDPEMRKAVKRVLGQIRERFPKDFERLQTRVLDIRPHRDPKGGTLGEVFKAKLDRGQAGSLNREDMVADGDVRPVYVEIKEDLEVTRHVDVLAHEFGHAATRQEDADRRGPTSDKWQSELAADWYAYKWGFGRDIAKYRKSRPHLHHGPPPGHEYSEPMGDGYIYHFKVSRNFVVRFLGKTKGEMQAPLKAS